MGDEDNCRCVVIVEVIATINENPIRRVASCWNLRKTGAQCASATWIRLFQSTLRDPPFILYSSGVAEKSTDKFIITCGPAHSPRALCERARVYVRARNKFVNRILRYKAARSCH
jgi:hypothetical protein